MYKQRLVTFFNKEEAEKYAENLNGELVHKLFPYDGEWFDVWFLWYKYESEVEDED